MTQSKPTNNHLSTSTEQKKLLATLQQELQQNPHFANSSLTTHQNMEEFSKYFLTKITSQIDAATLPDLSNTNLEPLLKLWHTLIKDFTQTGFSTKDITLLIYALKTSIQTYKSQQAITSNQFNPLETLLDLLGMLTFEIYTIENERLITRKDKQISYLQQQDTQFSTNLIGSSPAMNTVYKAMGLILDNDLTVLLQGESGTGKDLIASTIHTHSNRSTKPFVAINCGAIPKELIESELFGHEKGAFTGATEQRIGKFELADGGTLFLDEIGELSLDLQVKLLRVLQNKQIERIGSDKSIKLNVRIIAATNINLKTAVDNKTFRLDLYYRLNIFPIHIPALKERQEDIPQLTHYFIKKYAAEFKLTSPEITQEAIDYLTHQPWEGNIRELENTIQRSLILAQNKPITSSILSLLPGQLDPALTQNTQPLLQSPSTIATPTSNPTQILTLEQEEKRIIQRAITLKKGNIKQIAKALNISRTTLYAKINKYNITLPS